LDLQYVITQQKSELTLLRRRFRAESFTWSVLCCLSSLAPVRRHYGLELTFTAIGSAASKSTSQWWMWLNVRVRKGEYDTCNMAQEEASAQDKASPNERQDKDIRRVFLLGRLVWRSVL